VNTKPSDRCTASFCELTPAAERKLHEFESAWAKNNYPDIVTFVDDHDPALMEELVRVDMEFRAERGLPFSINEYLECFPLLTDSTGAIERIESEANRLKQQPRSKRSSSKAPFPEVPQSFLGFELIGVLGEGAFGRVYLARQDDLAKRLVVLKITTTRTSEGERLAQVQHTNIVPIYSQHEQGGLHAICMPFLGIATLADLIPSSTATTPEADLPPRELVSTVARKKSKTIPVLIEPQLVSRSVSIASRPASDPDPQSPWTENGSSTSYQTSDAESGSYEALGNGTREQTIGWLWHQTASGLAFAHRQGIIHGDVKPANILISDRGHPMLLDFNLAINRKDQKPQIVGGTLPYLSPEQIQAISSGTAVDERSDLYSLGIVFYQLLSGQLPFPDRGNNFQSSSKQMLDDRIQGAIPITVLLPNLNANLASIVDRSLHANLEHRYQSAAELLDDLQCYLEFKPLRHAANRSMVLRARNWLRRHPRLASASSVGLIAFCLLTVIGCFTFASWRHNAKLQAAENARRWIDDLKSVRYQLSSVDPAPSTLATRANELEQLINHPPAGIKTDEIIGQTHSLLSVTQAGEAKQELVASHLGLAGALLRQAPFREIEDRQKLLDQVTRHHQWVLEHIPERSESSGFLLQQGRRAFIAGEVETAKKLREQASKHQVNDSFDRNLLAYELLNLGEFNPAAELLEQVVASEGLDVEAWLLLGTARALQHRLAEAEACFSVCISLDENSETAIFNRARVRFDLGNLAGADADYCRAIELNPNEPSYFANRALIAMARQDWRKAEQDLSQAMKLPDAQSRIRYLRHQANMALGQEQLAIEDLDAFLKVTPLDEESWVMRGVANLQKGHRDQALLDFDEALKTNPRSSMAWQNKAAILTNGSTTEDKAIEAMTKVVELDPRNPTQIATRGVLLARSGKRVEAHRDAEAALQIDSSADTRYRVAGIYALTSKAEPADKRRAIALIAMAALEQPQLVLNYIEHDPDVEPLKTDPQWLDLIEALERIRQQAHVD
jgi:eukaryotic-like serine/threonine-protein kinase